MQHALNKFKYIVLSVNTNDILLYHSVTKNLLWICKRNAHLINDTGTFFNCNLMKIEEIQVNSHLSPID